MNVTHYDLFAGIGGFSYALDAIFADQCITHIFCEREPFPTAVLKKHWPEALYYGDIADLVADTNRQRRQRIKLQNQRRCGQSGGAISDQEQDMVILTGGFPCQPFSHIGRRQGTSDDRYKWPDMLAVIRNVRPDWVIAENVRGLATWNNGLVLETVCVDLESAGYAVQPIIIPACAVGAPHRRDRVWIIAHSADRGHGRWQCRSPESATRLSGRNRSCTPNWNTDWREVAFATCHDGVDDGLSRWMDGTAISAARHRAERLRACGNAIVPQLAMELFRAIRSTLYVNHSDGALSSLPIPN